MSRLAAPALLALPATIALAAVLAVRPGDRALALDAYLLLLGALALFVLAGATAGAFPRAASARVGRAPRGRHEVAPSVPELARLERVVELSTQSAFDAYYRLRPLLREIAADRLGRRGVDLDAGGPAEALLGPAAWRIVRPEARRPPDHFAPGVPLERVRGALEALERLS